MENKSGSFREKLSDFAGRFDERVRATMKEGGPKLLESTYWSIKDLLTEGVTREGLKDLIGRDTRDTFRFFTRGIDFVGLRGRPWYVRYPRTMWLVFLALAYRLSPPRRVAFAAAIFAILLGLLQSIAGSAQAAANAGPAWWLLGSGILFVLLLLELRDKLDLKGDLEIAREIQFGLVPASPFALGDFEIHCLMRPANTVGGDYYDIVELDENRIAVVVGDMSGKGMPAALLMALLQGSLRTLVTAGFRGGELIRRLNNYLCVSIPANSIVTLFYGELDTATGAFSYVNAGHNAPFLMRADGSSARLPATATVLGFMHELSFDTHLVSLAAGDRILLYTDGITEAFNESDVEFGEERLALFLSGSRHLRDDDLIRALIGEVMAFCGAARPADDMTLVTVERRNLRAG